MPERIVIVRPPCPFHRRTGGKRAVGDCVRVFSRRRGDIELRCAYGASSLVSRIARLALAIIGRAARLEPTRACARIHPRESAGPSRVAAPARASRPPPPKPAAPSLPTSPAATGAPLDVLSVRPSGRSSPTPPRDPSGPPGRSVRLPDPRASERRDRERRRRAARSPWRGRPRPNAPFRRRVEWSLLRRYAVPYRPPPRSTFTRSIRSAHGAVPLGSHTAVIVARASGSGTPSTSDRYR